MGAFYYFFSFNHSINQFPAKERKGFAKARKGHSIIQSISFPQRSQRFRRGAQRTFNHSLIQSFSHSINQFPAKVAKVSQRSAKDIQSFTHSIIQSFNQSVSRKGRKGFAEERKGHSIIHSFNHSVIQSISFPQRSQRFRRGHSVIHSFTHSIIHSFIQSFTHSIIQFPAKVAKVSQRSAKGCFNSHSINH